MRKLKFLRKGLGEKMISVCGFKRARLSVCACETRVCLVTFNARRAYWASVSVFVSVFVSLVCAPLVALFGTFVQGLRDTYEH